MLSYRGDRVGLQHLEGLAGSCSEVYTINFIVVTGEKPWQIDRKSLADQPLAPGPGLTSDSAISQLVHVVFQ